MRFTSLTLAAALAVAGCAPLPEETPVPVSLVSLFSDEDYPADAIRRGEQGTVQFRLDVGKDGRVRRCTVTGSSGSALLDSTTCRLVAERAHFQPRIGPDGRPARARYVSKVKWVIPTEPDG